jgi:hypothetical protein
MKSEKCDESGMGRDESGTGWDESGSAWDESAAREAPAGRFRPIVVLKWLAIRHSD